MDHSYKIPPGARLRKTREFENVYKNGQRFSCNTFVAVFYHNDMDYCRLGVVASKRVGNAIMRNRSKRRLREVFRTNWHNINVNHDIVLIARRQAIRAPFSEITNEFAQLIGKINSQ